MKRSCAPSKRFVTPFVGDATENAADSNPGNETSEGAEQRSESFVRGSFVALTSNAIINKTTAATRQHLIVPLDAQVHSSGDSCLSMLETDDGTVTLSGESNVRAFTVLWCKYSSRKHKVWEGDGELFIGGRCAVLKDHNKVIARSSGYPLQQLADLAAGSRLVISGKEVEIQDEQRSIAASSGSSCENLIVHKSPPVCAFVKPEVCSNAPPIKRPKFLYNFTPPRRVVLPCASGSAATTSPSSSENDDVFRMPKITEAQAKVGGASINDVVVDNYLARKLRPHQREGVSFMYECLLGMKTSKILNGLADALGNDECVLDNYERKDFFGCILADDMGLGKSLQAITLIWTLLKQVPYGNKPLVRKVLLVCPSSLINNWMAEFKKWLGNERLVPIVVQKSLDIQSFLDVSHCNVMIISYEMFMRNCDDLRNISFDLLVCDEGHRLKNSNVKTNCLLTSLGIKRKILLSGTPCQNDLKELFTLCDFVNPGAVGTTSMFRKLFENPISAGRESDASPARKELGAKRADQLNRITRNFMLRRTQEINFKYLPPKVEYVVFCRPSSLQLLLYSALINSRQVRLCFESALQKAPPLSCIDILRKICNHPVLLHAAASAKCAKEDDEMLDLTDPEAELENEELQAFLHRELLSVFPASFDADSVTVEDCGKLDVLFQLLRNVRTYFPSEKIVLVSNFTQTLDLLECLCQASDYSCLRLDGSTQTSERLSIVQQFNSSFDETFVFLLSSKAGGTGLNLIGANRLILYDPDWNPANDLQVLARIWRDGQKRMVHIYRFLTTGSIEEKIYQRQIQKQGLSSVAIGVDENVGKKPVGVKARKSDGYSQFSWTEMRALFQLDQSCFAHCQTHALIGCECLLPANLNSPSEPSLVSSTRSPTNSSSAAKSDGSISMAELKLWQHKVVPLPSDWEDSCLGLTDPIVTMVFRNITQPSETD